MNTVYSSNVLIKYILTHAANVKMLIAKSTALHKTFKIKFHFSYYK
jgi:hypothetical protein